MADDDPAARDIRGPFSQGRCDVLVGEPVEPVPPDPGIVQRPRQCEPLRYGRLAMVKGGIETRNLRQPGGNGRNGANRREIMRLMQRRQRA